MHAEIVDRKSERYLVVLVPSMSNPNITYRVDVVNRRCDCPSWKFAKTGPNGRAMCKHLIHLGFKNESKKVPENYEEHL